MQITNNLLRTGYPIWLDRYFLSPTENWDDNIRLSRKTTKTAIVFWSECYANSAYCQDELKQLIKLGKRFIIVQMVDNLPQALRKQASSIIPLPVCADNAAYQDALGQFATILENPVPLASEQAYLLDVIQTLETSLLAQLTAQISQYDEQAPVRPRCYNSNTWLTHGEYMLSFSDKPNQQAHAGKLVVQDVIQWVNINPQMLIVGADDRGKTSLLQHIARTLAHQRLYKGANYPLPIILSVAAWQDDDFDDFVQTQLAELDAEILLSNITLFIDDVHPDLLTNAQLDALEAWLHRDILRQVIMAVDVRLTIARRWQLPQLTIQQLSDEQVSHILKTIPIAEDVIQQVEQKSGWSLDHLAHYIFVATVLGEAYTITPSNAYAYMIEALHKNNAAYARQYTLPQLTHALSHFALTQLKQQNPQWIPYDHALRLLGDDELLRQAVTLGLLETRGSKIAFTSQEHQQYLAAAMLVQDGIYAHLTYPKFHADGTLKRSALDTFMPQIATFVEIADYSTVLDMIKAINPYLALDCYRQWQLDDVKILRDILLPMLHLGKAYWSPKAVLQSLTPLIAAYKENVADALMSLFGESDSDTHYRLYDTIAAIWSTPAEVAEAVKTLELDFPDAFYDALGHLSNNTVLLSLIKDSQNAKHPQRKKIVQLLGTLRVSASTTLLQDIVWYDKTAIRTSAIEALSNVNHKMMLETLYYAVSHAENGTARNAAIADLSSFGRTLSARLLAFLSDDKHHVSDMINIFVLYQESQLIDWLASILSLNRLILNNNAVKEPFVLQGASEEDNMKPKAILDALVGKMSSLENKPAFEEFVQDILQHLRGTSEKQPSDIELVKDRLRGMSRQKYHSVIEDEDTMTDIPRKLSLSLEHNNWIIRRKAIQQLVNYPNDQVLPLLLKALKDEDNQVQIAAIEMLPDPAENERVRQSLLDALDVNDFLVVDTAAKRLLPLGSTIVPDLINKLASPAINTLATTIDLLGLLQDSRAVEPLSAFLEDKRTPWLETKTLGDLAAAALIAIGTEEAATYVKALYPTLDSQTILMPDTEEASRDNLTHLMTDLQSDDWQASQQAAQHLREFAKRRRGEKAKNIAQRLVYYLDNENWIVRWAVIEALAWLQVPDTALAVSKLLQDKNWTVTVAAIRTLMELDAVTYTVPIAQLLDNNNSTIREAAAEALGILGNNDTVKLLEPALKDEDNFVRLAAVDALIFIGGKAATRLLLHHNDEYSHIRWSIAKYLTDFRTEKLLRTYYKMLNDKSKPEWEDLTVSNLAEQALGIIDTPESRMLLERWRKSKSDNDELGD